MNSFQVSIRVFTFVLQSHITLKVTSFNLAVRSFVCLNTGGTGVEYD